MKQLRRSVRALLESFWFLPGMLVAVGVLGSFVALSVDRRYSWLLGHTFLALFSGSAEAARQLLSVIAGSVITATIYLTHNAFCAMMLL